MQTLVKNINKYNLINSDEIVNTVQFLQENIIEIKKFVVEY